MNYNECKWRRHVYRYRAIVAKTENEMKIKMDFWNAELSALNKKININKTKIMVIVNDGDTR